MFLYRFLVLLALLSAAVSFALFAITGKPVFKRWGLWVFKATVAALLVFFAVMTLDRLAG